MNWKKVLIIAIVFVLFLLFVPIPKRSKDGDIIVYKTLIYKITRHYKNEDENNQAQEGAKFELFGKELFNSLAKDNTENKRLIMVDGKLYYDTGKESEIEDRCEMTNRKITSNITNSKIPYEDDQANFEGQYEYQISGEDTIDLYVEGKWIIFREF